MPLLAEVSTAQPAFHNFPRAFSAQSCVYVNKSLASLTVGNDKELFSFCKSLIIRKRVNFNVSQHGIYRRGIVITAVATLESSRLVHNGNEKEKEYNDSQAGFKNSEVGAGPSSSDSQPGSFSEESEELDEREMLRRERISKANKGNTPWNKGRKHSAETLRRIKERTRLAMQNPKVKMKLVNLGHAQSKETRVKIGVGVRMGWQRRREKLMLQENCHFDWQNLIAEAARGGYSGEEELQWDSYSTLNKKLEKEWLESVEKRKKMPRPVGSRRAPKSAAQRRKISESIAAKWADPEYRERVCSALSKYHGSPVGVEKRPRRKRSESSETTRNSQKEEINDVNSSSATAAKAGNQRFRKSKAPRFKDPLASSKLEMIKNIRAQRATAETQKMEAVERAKLLIDEAEKAAKALEVAATKSAIARASLMETRKLIAEATQLVESIDIEQTASLQSGEHSAATSLPSLNEEGSLAGTEDQNSAVQRKVNGTQLTSSSMDTDFDFSKFSLLDLLTGEKELTASSNGHAVSHLSFSSMTNQPNGKKASDHKPRVNGAKIHDVEAKAETESVTVTKKWVRGRLIEVADVQLKP